MSEQPAPNFLDKINPLDLPDQDPWETPLEELDIARPQYFERGEHWAYFERLRKEAPVHYNRESAFGPFWSVSSFREIKEVDQSHKLFSSEPAITIEDPDCTRKTFPDYFDSLAAVSHR